MAYHGGCWLVSMKPRYSSTGDASSQVCFWVPPELNLGLGIFLVGTESGARLGNLGVAWRRSAGARSQQKAVGWRNVEMVGWWFHIKRVRVEWFHFKPRFYFRKDWAGLLWRDASKDLQNQLEQIIECLATSFHLFQTQPQKQGSLLVRVAQR